MRMFQRKSLDLGWVRAIKVFQLFRLLDAIGDSPFWAGQPTWHPDGYTRSHLPPHLVQKWNESIQQWQKARLGWGTGRNLWACHHFCHTSIVSHGVSMGPMGCLQNLVTCWFQPRLWLESGNKGSPSWSLKISKCKLCKESTVDVFFFWGYRMSCRSFSLTQVLDLKKKHSNCLLTNMFFFVPFVFEFGPSSSLWVYQSLFASLGVWWPLDDRCFFSCTTQDWSLGRYMFTNMFARYTYLLI